MSGRPWRSGWIREPGDLPERFLVNAPGGVGSRDRFQGRGAIRPGRMVPKISWFLARVAGSTHAQDLPAEAMVPFCGERRDES